MFPLKNKKNRENKWLNNGFSKVSFLYSINNDKEEN